MLKKLLLGRIAAAERDLGYDMSYVRDVLEADFNALRQLAKLRGMSEYVRDVPPDAAFAVRLVGTLAEDCGPCTQLMVTMAERAGVRPETLRAVLRGDDAALEPHVLLCVHFARAVLRRAPEAVPLRDQIIARFGRRGLVTLAFGLTCARLYPTLKYALGHGRTCSRVKVGGEALVPKLTAAEPAGALP